MNHPTAIPPDSSLQLSISKTQPQGFVLEVNFQSAPGFTILFGPSGAGKTTLLDCVAGLTVPDSGRIAIGTRALFDANHGINIPTAKRRVGYVFQSLALFPHLTVEENIHYGMAHLAHAEQVARSSEIMKSFRIAHLADRKPAKISGGERQRTALARTLVTDPHALLLDEPLTALDAATKSAIIDDLRAWNREHGIPILYVTHSREEVFALGERVIVLDAGRIIAQGTPHEVISAPQQESVAQLVGFENVFDAVVEAVHPERGTMVCKITEAEPSHRDASTVLIETPMVRANVGSVFRVGIRAGDILLATSLPTGLSARNILYGHITTLEQRDVIISARVNCGVTMDVHLTLAARNSLHLTAGEEVWLVIKTHSCHLMERR